MASVPSSFCYGASVTVPDTTIDLPGLMVRLPPLRMVRLRQKVVLLVVMTGKCVAVGMVRSHTDVGTTAGFQLRGLFQFPSMAPVQVATGSVVQISMAGSPNKLQS